MGVDLFPFQTKHAERILQALNRHGTALDASEMGTGKTAIASHVAKTAGLSLLVVAPKAVLPAWQRVAVGFGTSVTEITNYERIKLGKTPFGRFEGKQFVWSVPPGTLLVFDEVQRC